MGKLEYAGVHAPAVKLGLSLGFGLGLQPGLRVEAGLLLRAGYCDGRRVGADGRDILLLGEEGVGRDGVCRIERQYRAAVGEVALDILLLDVLLLLLWILVNHSLRTGNDLLCKSGILADKGHRQNAKKKSPAHD